MHTTPRSYYASKTNTDETLRNGSFIRVTQYGTALFTLGDFVGLIKNIPEDRYKQITTEYAESIIPACCR